MPGQSQASSTSHPGAMRPYRGMPRLPDATTISAGIPPRRRGVRSCRTADGRRAHSATPVPRVRTATRVRPAVGGLSTIGANLRSPGHPPAAVPLPAASATGAGNVAPRTACCASWQAWSRAWQEQPPPSPTPARPCSRPSPWPPASP